MENDSLFKKRTIQPGEAELFPCNDFVLGVKRENEGWFVKVFENCNDIKEIDKTAIGEGEYFHSGKSNNLIITPALQHKPLVFKGNKILIAPRQRLTFFVKIPLVLQLYFSKIHDDNLLKGIPSKRLSDTWFGEPDNGVAAFALASGYQLDFAETASSEVEAVCPVSIFNDWDQQLEIQRLIIKADNLTLYKNNAQFVTSLVKLEYKGQNTISSVNYGTSKLYHGENPETIAKARSNDTKSLLKANFHFIRNIYNRTE
jgi:hypothetical protein